MHQHLYNKNKITQQDKAVFFEQLAALLSAGITLDKCLHVCIHTQKKARLRTRLTLLRQAILNGNTFSASSKHVTAIFDPYAQQLILLGEQTGKLDEVCAMLATHAQQQLQQTREITQTLFYPVLLLIISLLIFLSLLIVVVPTFADIYSETKQTLPLFTRIVFNTSWWLKDNLLLIIITTSISFFILKHWLAKRATTIGGLLDCLPPIKRLRRAIALSRAISQLSMALSAGIPLLTALSLSSQQSQRLKPAMQQLTANIQTGMTLHQAMQHHQEFPDILIHMTQIGEETGALDVMLNKANLLLVSEIQQHIRLLTQALEPLIMIVLGVLIGGLVIAMYLPIFNLGTTF